MPYISQEERRDLFAGGDILTAGQLNYQITVLVVEYLRTNKLNYQTINDIVGALEGAKAEFQRRVVNPYEKDKIETNGDVYE